MQAQMLVRRRQPPKAKPSLNRLKRQKKLVSNALRARNMQPDLSRIISAPGEPALYDVDLDYLFDYHPPTTEERKKKHQEINLAAKTAARSAISAVKAIWGEPEEATSTQSAATDILVNIQTAQM